MLNKSSEHNFFQRRRGALVQIILYYTFARLSTVFLKNFPFEFPAGFLKETLAICAQKNYN